METEQGNTENDFKDENDLVNVGGEKMPAKKKTTTKKKKTTRKKPSKGVKKVKPKLKKPTKKGRK